MDSIGEDPLIKNVKRGVNNGFHGKKVPIIEKMNLQKEEKKYSALSSANFQSAYIILFTFSPNWSKNTKILHRQKVMKIS